MLATPEGHSQWLQDAVGEAIGDDRRGEEEEDNEREREKDVSLHGCPFSMGCLRFPCRLCNTVCNQPED